MLHKHTPLVYLNAMEPYIASAGRPRWQALYEIAAGQEGHFSTVQAASVGYSPQHLQKHIKSGRIARVRRGIYRLVQFPSGDHEDLVIAWLWSEQRGVFSHETALSLHELSDVLPAKIYMTLPSDWRFRRLRVPNGVVVHFNNVDRSDVAWFGAVPVTAAARTLRDCISASVSPETLEKALADAASRGLLPAAKIDELKTTINTVKQ